MNHKISGKLIFFGIIAGLVIFNLSTSKNARGAGAFASQNPARLPVAQESSTLYLPLIAKRYPPPLPTFGVETGNIQSDLLLNRANEARVYWLRYPPIDWDKIEPVRTMPNPTYHWEVVDEAALQNVASHGLTLIATIRFTPGWAQKVPGVSCGPIRQDSLDAFAQFMQAVVERYGKPPYNIKYWEFGNEPDVDPSLVGANSIIGCWGDKTDPYYGGSYYAEMLKRIYPAMKAVDPQAKILNGGLLFECDPTYPPPAWEPGCEPSLFFEGILRNQGGDYLDMVSYHGYAAYYLGSVVDENDERWIHHGGMVLGKAAYLREVMAAYGVSKPVMVTESGLFCPSGWPNNASYCSPPVDAFYQAQADYVVWLFVRNLAAHITGTLWYTIENQWRDSGLFYDNGNTPKPAYIAYKFMTQEMADVIYVNQISLYPELRGYAFTTGDKRIWVLWGMDQLDHTISLPAGVTVVYDRDGNTILPAGGQITVNHPVYVELAP